MATTLTINGEQKSFDAPADMPLLWVLRDVLGMTGTKFGCGIAQCGACTVHIDGKPVRSCMLPVGAIRDRAVTTIEGIGATPAGAKVQKAWLDLEVIQCTPRNLAFALDNRKKFSGAATAGWRTFNISSDKATGIGAWRDDDLISYLSVGHAAGHGTASGPMGEAVDQSLSQLAPEDIRAMVAYLRSVPATASPDLPATLAPPAPASHRDGGTADPRGKMVFARPWVSCHGWSGQRPVSPMATVTGAWGVYDPGATNVSQIVITGTKRHTPQGAISMPAFGDAYSDDEIAAVANYVTARFGSEASQMTAQDVAELRKQTSQ